MDVDGPIAVTWIGWGVVAGLLIIVGLLFLQTRDVAFLGFGLLLAAGMLSALWVAGDSRTEGRLVLPWAIVALVLPVVGLVAYLLVRALRPRMAS